MKKKLTSCLIIINMLFKNKTLKQQTQNYIYFVKLIIIF